MSNLPPPTYPPYPPADYYGQPPTPIPASIKSLSIIAIVLASLFLLCDCIGLASAGMMLATGGKNPLLPNAPVVQEPGVQAFMAVDSLIKLALAGMLLAGGIGGLRLSRWARQGMRWWSVAALVWCTGSLLIQLTWTVPASVAHMAQAQSQSRTPMPGNMQGVINASAIISVMIAWAFWCAPAICFLLLWRSPQVVEAFEQTPPDPTPPGAQPFH